MLERTFMEQWVKERLKADPDGFWLRLADSADGIKPFDGVWWCGDGASVAVEFKVWRQAGPFKVDCVRAHQMRELLRFKQGSLRDAWIVVYFEKTEKVRIFKPTKRALNYLLQIDQRHVPDI